MNHTVEPTITEETGPMAGESATHPCFGQIMVSRVSSAKSVLYDSEFEHRDTLKITINTSRLHRTLSSNYHFAQDRLIEVEMSEAQWATMVSSPNVGGGVPCTLRGFNGQQIPGLPKPIRDREKFSFEFDEKVQSVLNQVQAIESAIDEAKLSATAKKAIERQLETLRSKINDSIPFVAERFAQHMETTVEKAKTEINSYATQTLIRQGEKLNAPIDHNLLT